MQHFGFYSHLDRSDQKGARRSVTNEKRLLSLGVVRFNNVQDVNKTKQSHSSRARSKRKQPTCHSRLLSAIQC